MQHQWHKNNDFKDGDFKNHILNEYNIPITENFLNNIFKKYNVNHRVKNLSNYQTAVTHISYLTKNNIKNNTAKLLKEITPISREKRCTAMPLQHCDYNRFEFLGDSVIHLVLTQYLYTRYHNQSHGFLTKLRTKLERDGALSALTKKLNIHKYAVIARNLEQNGARENDVHLTEDIFEALICALFLESSYDTCKKFLISLLESELHIAGIIEHDDNYKDKITQYMQKMRWSVKYEESRMSQKNNINAANQCIVVYIRKWDLNEDGTINNINGSQIIGVGQGNTRQKADQAAAYDALVKAGIIESENNKRQIEEGGYYNHAESRSSKDQQPIQNQCTDTNSAISDSSHESNYDELFFENDYRNHILNEKNIQITEPDIIDILNKYDCKSITKLSNIDNFKHAMIHVSYVERTTKLKEKAATMLKDIEPISKSVRNKMTKNNKLVLMQQYDQNRLSHLGNAIMHIIFTEYLYLRYPNKDEGFLTKLRTKIECTETIAKYAHKMGIHKFAIIARNMEQHNARQTDNSLIKNTLEAFVGALWEESQSENNSQKSYEICKQFVIKIIEGEDFVELLRKDDNYKEKIMLYFHKNGFREREPQYEDVKCDAENRVYVSNVVMYSSQIQGGCRVLGTGMGCDKGKAEQNAAHDALRKLGEIADSDDESDYYGEACDSSDSSAAGDADDICDDYIMSDSE